ncbi:MAG: cell division topological specificity factor MinE [Gammaproteobacteria bacterium]
MNNILSRIFGNRKSSAAIAKERLQIILAHEGNRDLTITRSDGFDFQSLQAEIIQVIARHLKIDKERVNVQLIERDKKRSIFELNVDLPDRL